MGLPTGNPCVVHHQNPFWKEARRAPGALRLRATCPVLMALCGGRRPGLRSPARRVGLAVGLAEGGAGEGARAYLSPPLLRSPPLSRPCGGYERGRSSAGVSPRAPGRSGDAGGWGATTAPSPERSTHERSRGAAGPRPPWRWMTDWRGVLLPPSRSPTRSVSLRALPRLAGRVTRRPWRAASISSEGIMNHVSNGASDNFGHPRSMNAFRPGGGVCCFGVHGREVFGGRFPAPPHAVQRIRSR